MTSSSIAEKARSCVPGVESRSCETTVVRLLIAAAVPAIGVSSPISSAAPTRISSNPITQGMGDDEVESTIVPIPWTTPPVATVTRKRIRPTPGHPLGNVEKSFCRRRLLAAESFSDEVSV
jgi:hypothetical protein